MKLHIEVHRASGMTLMSSYYILYIFKYYIIVYNNYVNLFFIYVCLLTEIEFDVGV